MSVVKEIDPKKRLVGSAILIGLAVIVLPIILDNDDTFVPLATSDQDQVILGLKNDYISSEEEVTVFVSKITPIGENRGSIDKPFEEKASNLATQASSPISVKESSPVSVPAKLSSESTSIVERGWAVRVGTFANATNAQKLLVDLSKKGFTPDSEAIETSNGMATRIWIGPYERRVDAARARTQLEQQTGEPGLITVFP